MQEMHEKRGPSLGGEEPLQEEMATRSSILAWEMPWMEELGRIQSTGPQRVGHDQVTEHTHIFKNIGTLIFKQQTHIP